MPQWIGGPEFVIIVLVIVVVFGWKKLPDAARSLGRSMRIFKSEVTEMKHDGAGSTQDTVPGQSVPTAPPATAAPPAHTPPPAPTGHPGEPGLPPR